MAYSHPGMNYVASQPTPHYHPGGYTGYAPPPVAPLTYPAAGAARVAVDPAAHILYQQQQQQQYLQHLAIMQQQSAPWYPPQRYTAAAPPQPPHVAVAGYPAYAPVPSLATYAAPAQMGAPTLSQAVPVGGAPYTSLPTTPLGQTYVTRPPYIPSYFPPDPRVASATPMADRMSDPIYAAAYAAYTATYAAYASAPQASAVPWDVAWYFQQQQQQEQARQPQRPAPPPVIAGPPPPPPPAVVEGKKKPERHSAGADNDFGSPICPAQLQATANSSGQYGGGGLSCAALPWKPRNTDDALAIKAAAGTAQDPAAASVLDPCHLVVKFLPAETTDAALAELFASFGTVVDARIIRDRVSGHSKGYGFVDFADEAHGAAALLAMDGHSLGGKRPLKVACAARERAPANPVSLANVEAAALLPDDAASKQSAAVGGSGVEVDSQPSTVSHHNAVAADARRLRPASASATHSLSSTTDADDGEEKMSAALIDEVVHAGIQRT